MKTNVGIVIPFYYLSDNFQNDIVLLQKTIDILNQYSTKIIVVDDGTALQTVKGAELVKHKSNLGKGCAIRTGLEHLLFDKKIEFIVEVDADNDQDPREIIRFMEKFEDRSPTDQYLIIGDRYSAPQMAEPGKYRESINKIQTWLFSQFGFSIRDSVSGFRGYSRVFAQEILQKSSSAGFGIATEELILAYLADAAIEEIPLQYAKPRKLFTKAFKLGEVLEGITIHGEALKQRGHIDLLNILEEVKTHIDRKEDFKLTMGNQNFEFMYKDFNYTIR